MGFTMLTDKTVVTRKPHKCFGCITVFPKGTEMQYQFSVHSNKYDGGSAYLCMKCLEHIRDNLDLQYDMAEFGVSAGFILLEQEST